MIFKKNVDSDPVCPVFAAHDNKRSSSATRARTSHRRRRSPHHQRPPPPPPAPSVLPQASTSPTAGARPSYCRRAPPPLPARTPPPAGVRPSSCRRPPPLLSAPAPPAAGARPPCCWIPPSLRPARASQKRPGPARRRACSAEWAVQRSEQKSAIARVFLKMECTHFPPKVNSRR